MDNNSSHSSQPCRGVIVVDGNDLSYLATPYALQDIAPGSPLALLENPTGTYMDLLPVLAKRGYDIVISEMVSEEAGNVLANGNNLSLYFKKNPVKYSREPQVRAFLIDAAFGKYSGITIEKAQGDAPYARYLQELHKAIDRKFGNDDGAHTSIKQEIIINQRIIDIRRRWDTQDFGDKQSHDIISGILKKQAKQGPLTPVFFLSADSRARKELKSLLAEHKQADQVKLLTAKGAIKGIENETVTSPAGQQTLMALLGLKTSGVHIWKSICESMIDDGQHFDKHIYEYHPKDNNGENYQDSPLDSYATDQKPFAQSLKGLAQELLAEQETQAAEAKSMPKQPSQKEKFLAKWGNRPVGNGSRVGPK